MQPPVEPVITPEAPTVEVPVAAAPAQPASKGSTIWCNGAAVALGAAMSVAAVFEPQWGERSRRAFANPELGVAMVAVVTSLVACVNVALRSWQTSQPIQQ